MLTCCHISGWYVKGGSGVVSTWVARFVMSKVYKKYRHKQPYRAGNVSIYGVLNPHQKPLPSRSSHHEIGSSSRRRWKVA